MSEFARHIPLILLTIIFAMSTYYMYRNLTTLSLKMEYLSQDFDAGIATVNEFAAQLQSNFIASESRNDDAGKDQAIDEIQPDDILMTGKISDDVKSIASADVRVANGKESQTVAIPTEMKEVSIPMAQTTAPIHCDVHLISGESAPVSSEVRIEDEDEDEEDLGDVEKYIGDLEESFVKKPSQNQLKQDVRQDDDAMSESSSVSNLNGRKKCPPFSARNFSESDSVQHNGKLYSPIVSKSGVKRWGAGRPLEK